MTKEQPLSFDVQPYEHALNLLPDSQRVRNPVTLNVFNTEKVLDVMLIQKQPAFLGERYSIFLQLKPFKLMR